MESEPLQHLSETIHALSGICELLCIGQTKSDMHMVDPSNLFYVLAMVRDQQEAINEALWRDHWAARKKPD